MNTKIIVIFVVNLCALVTEGQSETQTQYNPLVMIKNIFGGYKRPRTVKIENNQRTFNGHKTETYLCPGANSDLNEELKNVNLEDAALYLTSCFFERDFNIDEPKVCEKEAQPIVTKFKKLGFPYTCGPKNKGILYGVSYMICKPANKYRQFISKKENIKSILSVKKTPMFNFCYDHKRKKTIFTKHWMSSTSILRNLNHLTDLTNYKSDGISTYNYQKFGNDLEELANRIKQTGLVPHQAVPAKDMVFAGLKKSTYYYINVMGMPEENHLLWNFIDDRIRRKATMLELDLQIRMGEFVSLELEKFWCKMVYDYESNSGVAIIVRHSEQNFFSLITLNYCKNGCKLYHTWEGYEEKMRTDLIYCCDIDENHLDLFGIFNIDENTIAFMDLDALGRLNKGGISSIVTDFPSRV